MKSQLAVVGSGFSAVVITQTLLSYFEEIHVIDTRPELGLPTQIPGMSSCELFTELVETLDDSAKQLMRAKHDEKSWFRSEWLVKAMWQKTATGKVITHTRQRIVKTNENEGQINLHLQGLDGDSELQVSYVIDARLDSAKPVNGMDHVLNECSKLVSFDFGEQQKWFGGLCVLSEQQFLDWLNNESLIIGEHSDGVSEVWMRQADEVYPQNGWIQKMEISLPKSWNHPSIDEVFQASKQICAEIINELEG